MRAAPAAEPLGEALEVDLIDSVEDRHHGLLNDFLLECRNVQRALPPVSLRNKDSPRGLCPIRFEVHPAVQIDKSICLLPEVLVARVPTPPGWGLSPAVWNHPLPVSRD
jgi:hypothetical protein